MATTTTVSAAGPSGAPAAVLHPTDTPSKTWRVVSEWHHDGERGAWVERINGHGSDRALAQVIYRDDAPVGRRAGSIGQALGRAQELNTCPARPKHWYHDSNGYWKGYVDRGAEQHYRDRLDYYTDVDINQIDQAEQIKWDRTPASEKWTTLEDLTRLRNTQERVAEIKGSTEPEPPNPIVAATERLTARITDSAVAMLVTEAAPRLLIRGRESGPHAAREGNDEWRPIVAEKQGDAFAQKVHERMAAIIDAAFGPAEPEWPEIPDVFRQAFEE